MNTPAGRPTWEQHPLWLDRDRLEAIYDRMWTEIQKVMFPGKPRRPRRNPGKTELTIVGGASVEDVYSEAVRDLLRYEPEGSVNWEGLGITIAHRRAVDAVRTATTDRRRPDGPEIAVMSLDLTNEEGGRLLDELPASGDLMDDQAVDRVLRADRVLAIRAVAAEVLPQRDRDIFYRVTRGETRVAIAEELGITPQRVGQIFWESVRKIEAGVRSNPNFRRLSEPEPEGGNPND